MEYRNNFMKNDRNDTTFAAFDLWEKTHIPWACCLNNNVNIC